MKPEIGQAMMTILGTLPVGAEVRFYWDDGVQHMSIKYADGTEDVARLNRVSDGVGVLSPAVTH